MYQKIKTLFLTCETPLHAGSGDSLGIVDLPIQRERHTSFPKIEASSLKGAIREAFEQHEGGDKGADAGRKNDVIHDVFGPDEGPNKNDVDKIIRPDAHAGAIGLSDVRLLLFPIKSMKGIYAYATCPRILQKLQLDMKTADVNIPSLTNLNDQQKAKVTNTSALIVREDRVILEEYTFTTKKDEDITKLAEWLADNIIPNGEEYTYWRDKIKDSLIVLPDNEFKDFVNLSTEVITRTKINNETGTVESGALFTEEYLPQESILYTLVMASPLFIEKDADGKNKRNCPPEIKNGTSEEVMGYIEKTFSQIPVFQLGGNATLGKGLLRTRLL